MPINSESRMILSTTSPTTSSPLFPTIRVLLTTLAGLPITCLGDLPHLTTIAEPFVKVLEQQPPTAQP